MSKEKSGGPQPLSYVTGPAHNQTPGSNFGRTNYSFYSSGTPGSYPMNTPARNSGSASNYSNVVVTQVGPGTVPVYNTPPPDYTTKAWLVCLCCFWPTGLLAISRARESQDCVARGDMAGAHAAANRARKMVKISFILGIISLIVFGIIFGASIAARLKNYNHYN